MYQLIVNGVLQLTTDVLMDIVRTLNRAVPPTSEGISVTMDGLPLEVDVNPYGKRGVLQRGDAKEIAVRLLDEVDHAYIRPEGRVRQPWEMMPDEWLALVMLGGAAYNVYPCFTADQRAAVSGFGPYLDDEIYVRFGYGHNGPLFGKPKQSNSRHEVHVAYALAEGKPVPDDVIAWYKGLPTKGGCVGEWFTVLLDYPEYRGKITAEKLATLAALLRNDGKMVVLTNENAPFFINLMGELQPDVTMTQMDDFMYQRGLLQVREAPLMPKAEGVAYSPLADTLRTRLGLARKAKMIAGAHEAREKYGHTLRELHADLAQAELVPAAEAYGWANLVAEAVDKKDVAVLLSVLDTPDDANRESKKVIRETLGLKILGLKAAERRADIFRFCGYDDAQRAAFEQELDARHAAKKAADDEKSAREHAERATLQLGVGGEVVNGAEYVDRCIAEGFGCITTMRRGATTTYWLYNPASGMCRSINKANGTLDYARTVRKLEAHREHA